jgi:hypothetical protein
MDMRFLPMLFLFVCGLALAHTLAAQNGAVPGSSSAAVFQLGQDEAAYEKLTQDYARGLLVVSNNDMKQALNNWYEVLKSMQDHANASNFNISSLKVYLHVFWNADGSIHRIGYFLMPDSRNFKPEEIKAFFGSFIRQYQPKLRSDKNFSHYTSASFPILWGNK